MRLCFQPSIVRYTLHSESNLIKCNSEFSRGEEKRVLKVRKVLIKSFMIKKISETKLVSL